MPTVGQQRDPRGVVAKVTGLHGIPAQGRLCDFSLGPMASLFYQMRDFHLRPVQLNWIGKAKPL
jgi:hypothetical protein